MTTVSVIIPTWNRAVLLEEAIKSALFQTFSPLEVLVCDDGSTDDSEHVVLSFKDPRLVWLPGAHSGLPAEPRNRGIAHARGEWVAFLDSDDQWMPDKLLQQLTTAKELMCDAVCSDAYHLRPGQNALEGVLIGISTSKLTFTDLLVSNMVVCSSVLVKTSLIRNVGGFSVSQTLVGCEDYALWLRVSSVTDFMFVNKPLLIYRDYPQTSVRAIGSDAWFQTRKVLEDFLMWGCKNKINVRYFKAAINCYCGVLQIQIKRKFEKYRKLFLRKKLRV